MTLLETDHVPLFIFGFVWGLFRKVEKQPLKSLFPTPNTRHSYDNKREWEYVMNPKTK